MAVSRRSQIAAQLGKPPQMRSHAFPAPIAGWVTADAMIASRPNSAQVLENFFPTQKSIRTRGGLRMWGSYGINPIRSMLVYNVEGNAQFFTSTGDALWNSTAPTDIILYDQNLEALTDESDDPLTIADPPTPAVAGLTGGYYCYVNFATSGGYFLIAVNGTDQMRIYDGSNWYPIGASELYRISYNSEVAPFTVGETVSGAVSGASATIVRAESGYIWINNLIGSFDGNETITDGQGGEATTDAPETLLWNPVTGVATNALSHVSAYRNRLFFVEQNTFRIWYPSVNTIVGAFSSFNLDGVFQKGGSILFTATWSMDAGDGMDDKFVIVSTEGEVAVYQGSNPSDADDWHLVGRYEMTHPMGPRGSMRVGGDLYVLTREGLVPISLAITKGPDVLAMGAVSRNIEPNWLEETTQRRSLPWEIQRWPLKNMGFVTLPINTQDAEERYCFVFNLETGAWAKYTGWDTRCCEVFNDQLFIGTSDGKVMQCEVGGDDDGTPYYPVFVGNWEALQSFGSIKTVYQARATFITKTDIDPQLSVSVDYSVELPPKPNAPVLDVEPSLWDVGRWDRAIWDAGNQFYTVSTRWVSIGRTGYSIAPQLQMASSGNIQPTAELAEITITFETGGLVV
ncbi:MAG: hypothetical protein M9945_12730 [Aquamicrobium sp.]|uniref:hypothetical protein n=1 Tax=Aquamicrobium sp. TaxID=1872579 RepID=UPI00349EDB70|nr:hypothetical protein [Aquamicrobium sp.]